MSSKIAKLLLHFILFSPSPSLVLFIFFSAFSFSSISLVISAVFVTLFCSLLFFSAETIVNPRKVCATYTVQSTIAFVLMPYRVHGYVIQL